MSGCVGWLIGAVDERKGNGVRSNSGGIEGAGCPDGVIVVEGGEGGGGCL